MINVGVRTSRVEDESVALPDELVQDRHRWKLVDRMGTPPLWWCDHCKVFGFQRRKFGVHRLSPVVPYQCSFMHVRKIGSRRRATRCGKLAKIKSMHRGTGGLFRWACGEKHAKGSRFT
jgi:hypothetical protein